MSLLREVESCLRNAGYRVQTSGDRVETVLFEDYSLFGFATIYGSPESILRDWKRNQDEFLQKNAPFLRLAARKAWNCYTVHLTERTPSNVELQALFEIEEDFTSTRKIARGSIATGADVHRALYPLIPIQNLLKMQVADQELGLATRIHDWPDGAVTALLADGTAEDVIELLLEAE